MKMDEFQLLLREEQVTVLYQEGVYIGKIKTGQLVCILFQLEDFYVEIFYTSYRRIIHKIGCSKHTAILDPYLEQIPIEFLVT